MGQMSAVLDVIAGHPVIDKVAIRCGKPGFRSITVPHEPLLQWMQVYAKVLSMGANVKQDKKEIIHQQLHANRLKRIEDACLLNIKLTPNLLTFAWKGFTKTGSVQSLCYELLQTQEYRLLQEDYTVPVSLKR